MRQKKIVFLGMFLLSNICFAVPPSNMLSELQNGSQSKILNKVPNASPSNWISKVPSNWISELPTQELWNLPAARKACLKSNLISCILRKFMSFDIEAECRKDDGLFFKHIRIAMPFLIDNIIGDNVVAGVDEATTKAFYSFMCDYSTNKSYVYAMDNGVVKNTTLASMVPGVWAALKRGPLKNNEAQYTKIIPEFIVKVGSLGTDNVGKKLFVNNENNDPAVSAFIGHLNNLFHKNDTSAILRKNNRRYFQVHQNIRGGLLCILIAVYYGINIDDTCNRGESFRFPDPKEAFSESAQKETRVLEQTRSFTSAELSELDGTSVIKRTTHTINYRVEETLETKKISYKTTGINCNFIEALLCVSYNNPDKQSIGSDILKLLTKSK